MVLVVVHQRLEFDIVRVIARTRKLKSAAKALRFNAGQIPANRVDQLQAEVLSHYPAGTELSADLLGEASEINTQ